MIPPRRAPVPAPIAAPAPGLPLAPPITVPAPAPRRPPAIIPRSVLFVLLQPAVPSSRQRQTDFRIRRFSAHTNRAKNYAKLDGERQGDPNTACGLAFAR